MAAVEYKVIKKNLNEEIKNKIQERDNMVESYKTNLRVSEAGAPIQIGNDAKNKHANIIFYMKNFSYPIIKIKYFNSRNKNYIEVDNNIKKTNLSNINEINIWFKNYFLDKAKI